MSLEIPHNNTYKPDVWKDRLNLPVFYQPSVSADKTQAKLALLLQQSPATISDRALFESLVDVYATVLTQQIELGKAKHTSDII